MRRGSRQRVHRLSDRVGNRRWVVTVERRFDDCTSNPDPNVRALRDAAVECIRVVQELNVNSHVLHIQFKRTITERNMLSLWPLCVPFAARLHAPCTMHHHAGHV